MQNKNIKVTSRRSFNIGILSYFALPSINPKSVFIDGKYIAGYYYYKELK